MCRVESSLEKRLLFQQIHHLCAEDMSVVAARLGGEHTRGSAEKTNFSLHPAFREVGERHMRGPLRGGPAVARLVRASSFCLADQEDFLGTGSRQSWAGVLGAREVVASCRAWAPSISPLLPENRGSGVVGAGFGCLLSRRQIWGDWKAEERAGCVWRRSVALA